MKLLLLAAFCLAGATSVRAQSYNAEEEREAAYVRSIMQAQLDQQYRAQEQARSDERFRAIMNQPLQPTYQERLNTLQNVLGVGAYQEQPRVFCEPFYGTISCHTR